MLRCGPRCEEVCGPVVERGELGDGHRAKEDALTALRRIIRVAPHLHVIESCQLELFDHLFDGPEPPVISKRVPNLAETAGTRGIWDAKVDPAVHACGCGIVRSLLPDVF